MGLNKIMQGDVNYRLFASSKEVPFVVFFDSSAPIVRTYPYIKANQLYTMVHYFQDPSKDIMFHLLELDHYIKFEAGGFYVGNSICIN